VKPAVTVAQYESPARAGAAQRSLRWPLLYLTQSVNVLPSSYCGLLTAVLSPGDHSKKSLNSRCRPPVIRQLFGRLAGFAQFFSHLAEDVYALQAFSTTPLRYRNGFHNGS